MANQEAATVEKPAWSHGETLKKAREGLIFKISSRDTTEFKNWKLDTKITLSQAIKSYRAITGVCEQGVREWMKNGNGMIL